MVEPGFHAFFVLIPHLCWSLLFRVLFYGLLNSNSICFIYDLGFEITYLCSGFESLPSPLFSSVFFIFPSRSAFSSKPLFRVFVSHPPSLFWVSNLPRSFSVFFCSLFLFFCSLNYTASKPYLKINRLNFLNASEPHK